MGLSGPLVFIIIIIIYIYIYPYTYITIYVINVPYFFPFILPLNSYRC